MLVIISIFGTSSITAILIRESYHSISFACVVCIRKLFVFGTKVTIVCLVDSIAVVEMFLLQGIVYSLLEKTKEAEESFEIYRSLIPEEFPQRGFLDDVVLAAKTESKQQLDKELHR